MFFFLLTSVFWDFLHKKRRPSGLLFLEITFRIVLLHNELDGLGEAVGFDVAEVDAALEVDADGVFT